MRHDRLTFAEPRTIVSTTAVSVDLLVAIFCRRFPLLTELGGVVTEDQCRTLADYLTPSVGGLYMLPGACSRLLKTDDAELAKQYEKENAEVYARLKKRKTVVAKAGYPPTAC